ncbi:hypothetical protein Hanom_Chr12g01143891 [Helianthus anomalus]
MLKRNFGDFSGGSDAQCNLTKSKILTMKQIIQLLSWEFEPDHMPITFVSSKVR